MESKEEKLARQAEEIAELARKNKKIDAPAMVEMLLASHESSYLPPKEKIRAYVATLIFPPMGLYYFLKFFFREESDARITAFVCLILGAVSLILIWWSLSVLFSSTPELNQIKNITPQQIQELTQ